MYTTITETNVPVNANGQYGFYRVPHNMYARIVTLAGTYTGTYNLDAFILWPTSDSNAAYLDSSLNRGTPWQIPSEYMNGWLNPGWQLMFQVSNHTVNGVVSIRMWIELVSREEQAMQQVSVKESIELDTRPFGRLFG